MPGRMGQLVKTVPLTNEANSLLSVCATPSSNLPPCMPIKPSLSLNDRSGEPVQVDAAKYITYHDAKGMGTFLDADFEELASVLSFTVDYLAGTLRHVDAAPL